MTEILDINGFRWVPTGDPSWPWEDPEYGTRASSIDVIKDNWSPILVWNE